MVLAMKPIENDKTTSIVLDANGVPVTLPTVLLSSEDAALLRLYKKFLQRHGIQEANYCQTCWDRSALEDGMRVFVTDADILFECRHRRLIYKGQSY